MSVNIDVSTVKTLLSEYYAGSILNEYGIIISELTFQNQNITLKDCTKCEKEYLIQENGLYEDNVVIFWYFCKKSCKDGYCAGKNKNHDNRVKQPYRFCYNEEIIEDVENAIRAADYIQSVAITSNNTLEIINKKLEYGENLTQDIILREYEGRLKGITKARRRMWSVINEGLRRLLVPPKDHTKNEAPKSMSAPMKLELGQRNLHGHQLIDLIKRDRYNVLPYKEDVLVLGHFHLQMIMRHYDTWIVHSGHFITSKMPRQSGFLSHIGAPTIKYHPSQDERQIEPLFETHRW